MSSGDWQHFLNDLRAAVIAGVPIGVGQSMNGSMGSVENLLTTKSLDAIEEHGTFAGGNLKLPERLTAAHQVFSATNDMPLVLRALSAANHASRRAIRYLRWTIAYLVIVLLVAWLGMIFFAIVLVPEIESMRADFLFSRRPDVATSHTFLPWIGYLTWIFGALSLIALIALCVGGTRKFVMLAGGRYFVRSRVEASAAEVCSRLIESGIDPSQADELAFQLVGYEAKSIGSTPTAFRSPFDSSSAASVHLRSGDRHLERIRATVPTVLVFLVGGCISLIYGVAVFAPILDLLRDLMISGV